MKKRKIKDVLYIVEPLTKVSRPEIQVQLLCDLSVWFYTMIIIINNINIIIINI